MNVSVSQALHVEVRCYVSLYLCKDSSFVSLSTFLYFRGFYWSNPLYHFSSEGADSRSVRCEIVPEQVYSLVIMVVWLVNPQDGSVCWMLASVDSGLSISHSNIQMLSCGRMLVTAK